MKKFILKTAFITIGVTAIFAVSLFGIVSFVAPAAMMRFCEQLGLSGIGSEYAYEEYLKGNDLGYLAHSFELDAENGNYARALERFDELYGTESEPTKREAFGEFCEKQNNDSLQAGIPDYDYRAYLCGRAACVKYHLARTPDSQSDACAFAIRETGEEIMPESPVMALTIEAVDAEDAAFCGILLGQVRAENKFETDNIHYLNLVKFLEDAVDEQ